MAHLYPHLRLHQVFGANTDVGKTIFTTALCLASSALPLGGEAPPPRDVFSAQGRGEQVHYLKPVSTGAMDDSDDAHVSRYATGVKYRTLYRFSEPVSPHLAVELERRAKRAEREVGEGAGAPTEEDFVRDVGDWIHAAARAEQGKAGVAYVETAGGVHSPGPSGLSQSHLLRPLRLPTILIGSAELGGISTTRSAFESLLVAGYDVDAVLLFPSPRYGNVEYLTKFFAEEHGIPVFGLGGVREDGEYGPPPVKNADSAADKLAMTHFYRTLVHGHPQPPTPEHTPGGVYNVIHHLRSQHTSRIASLSTFAQRTRDTCWWPFTQHQLTPNNQAVNVIDSAHGDFFSMLDQRHPPAGAADKNSLLQPVLDGSASWWTQCLGHAPQRLVMAAAKAGGRYGHVLFPNGTHEPALLLSELLTGKNAKEEPSLESNPGYGWADRVFFSDDGSTGMEVALKMALQASIQRYSTQVASSEKAAQKAKPGQQAGYQAGKPKQEWEVLGLKGSYHGDTIGAMDACEPSVYSEAVHWYRGRGFWFDAPTVEMRAGGKVAVSLAVEDKDLADRMRQRHLPKGLSTSSSSDKAIFQKEYNDMQEVYDVEARLRNNDPLVEFYRSSIRDQLEQLTIQQQRRFGALVLEPLVMGAGGMIFVDPLFQRVLIDTCRQSEDLFSLSDAPLTPPPTANQTTRNQVEGNWQGIPVIFDEVFAGLYRLGLCTPATTLGVTPDISVLAKILTGGMVPMSVTLASSSIFKVFNQSDSKVDALLHGHSYTAHPIGCAVALETLKAISELKQGQDWQRCRSDWSTAPNGVWSFWSRSSVAKLAELPNVDHAIAMGCVLKVALKDGSGAGGYTSTASVELLKKLRFGENATQGHPSIPVKGQEEGKLPYNVHARPLGNVIYLMSSLNSPEKVLRSAEEVLLKGIAEEAGL